MRTSTFQLPTCGRYCTTRRRCATIPNLAPMMPRGRTARPVRTSAGAGAPVQADTVAAGACNLPCQIVKAAKTGLDISLAVV